MANDRTVTIIPKTGASLGLSRIYSVDGWQARLRRTTARQSCDDRAIQSNARARVGTIDRAWHTHCSSGEPQYGASVLPTVLPSN